ncbi:MFS transporter [Chthonomonas sp.]|uniref:MFS transporter n=1 Tax=Chthonomonas sp. TaxID=2282153 RepID=UPI002B4B6715|nr:MFS transporter [Chthonomonas sp.]
MNSSDGESGDRRTLWVLSLYQLFSNNRSSLFTVYFVLFLVVRERVSVAEGLVVLSTAYFSSSLIGPVAGRISDRLGRRRLLLLVAEASSLPFFALIPVVPGFLLVGVFFVVGECLLSLGSTALQAFIADVTPPEGRGAGYGLVGAVGAAGSILGVLVAGVVAEVFGLDAIFYMVGFIMAGTILLIVFAIPEVNLPPSPSRKPLKEMKSVAVFSLSTSVRTLGTGAVTAFFATYAYSLGADPFDVSLVAVAGLGATALLGARLGRAVDRVGEIRGYVYGTLVVVVSLFVYAVSSSWLDVIPARVIYSAGFALLSPAMLSWVTKVAPADRRAEYLGFFSLINSTLWSLGPLPGGAVEALWGPLGLFAFAAATSAASVVAVLTLYPTPKRTSPPT